jgi:hypothetical protein
MMLVARYQIPDTSYRMLGVAKRRSGRFGDLGSGSREKETGREGDRKTEKWS